MSLRYIEDVALMQPTIPTSTKGVETVVKYYKNSTNELKNLLQNECDVILECNYCKNLFRSIVNFVTHKRTYCRSLSQSVTAMSTVSNQVNEFIRNGASETPETRKVAEEKEQPRSSKSVGRPLHSLRRVNLTAAINKHVEKIPVRVPNSDGYIELNTLPRIAKPAPITSFHDGHQWVEEIPPNLAVKERLPEDRVLLLMPQDKSIRYGEMQLRRRKDANSQENTREIKYVEAQMLEHLPAHVKDLADLRNFTCGHSDCKGNQQSYPSVMILVYHLCIQHSHDIQPTEKDEEEQTDVYTCFICQKQIKSLGLLHTHLISRHKHIHQAYLQCGGVVGTVTPARKSTRNKNVKGDDSTNQSAVYSEHEEDEETEVESVVENVEKERTESTARERRKYHRRSLTHPEEIEFNKKVIIEIEGIDNSLKNEVARELTVEEAEEIDKLLQSNNVETREKEKLLEPKQEEEDVNAVVRQCVSNIKAIIANDGRESTREPTLSPPSETEEKVQYSDEGSEVANSSAKHVQRRSRSSIIQQKQSFGRRKNLRPKKIDSDSKSDSGSSQRNLDRDDDTIEGEEAADELLIANRPRRAARRPERFRDDDFITYERKRNSDNLEVVSEGDSSNKPTPAKKIRRPELVGKMKSEEKSSDTTFTPSPPESQESEKSPIKKLRLDLTKLAKKRISEIPKIKSKEIHDYASIQKPKSSENAATLPENAQASNKHDWVLPPPKKPIHAVDNAIAQRQLDPKEYHEDLKFYTPRARKVREDDDEKSIISRRKQVLPRETDDITILKAPGHIPPRPADLSEIPVYLTEVQRDIFFAPLKPLFTGKLDGNHQCSECGAVLRSIQEGRRHMVGHIRVVRLRCSLCDVGAFFCSDMRTHLMNRHCPNLHLAPSGYVKEGIPCMSRQQADELSRLVDPKNPGRVMYTSGKIISADNPIPYRPDARIEENILGPARPHYLSRSPKKAHLSSDTPTTSSNMA